MRQNLRRILTNCRFHGQCDKTFAVSCRFADISGRNSPQKILPFLRRCGRTFAAFFLRQCGRIFAASYRFADILGRNSSQIFSLFCRFYRNAAETFAAFCRISVFTVMRRNFRITLPFCRYLGPKESSDFFAVLSFCRFFGNAAESSPHSA